MTYYCIYKDECKNKKCQRRKTFSRISPKGVDLGISPLFCSHVNDFVVLTSEDRVMCKYRLKCGNIDCILKRDYIIKEDQPLTIKCSYTKHKIKLIIDGNKDTCLSIWE